MTKDEVLSALGEISQHFENCAEATCESENYRRCDVFDNLAACGCGQTFSPDKEKEAGNENHTESRSD